MKKRQYRIHNWSDYNAALVDRGRITLWFDEESTDSWFALGTTGKRGRPCVYSDIAMTCLLLIRSVFKLDFRKLQGFAESLAALMDIDIAIPSYTQICRRQSNLKVDLSHIQKDEPIHVVVDSTGLKVFGEGEWKTRQHGISKRRTWRKLHLGVDESSGEVVAMELTTNDVTDGEVFPDLLEQIAEKISCVSADGAYDKRNCYDAIDERSAQANIPPRKDAVLKQHGNCKAPALTRDENIRGIRKLGRKKWKKNVGYHRRSLSETAMFRIKQLFGGKLSARLFENQVTEAIVRCKAMNKMTQLGMPDSQPI